MRVLKSELFLAKAAVRTTKAFYNKINKNLQTSQNYATVHFTQKQRAMNISNLEQKKPVDCVPKMGI